MRNLHNKKVVMALPDKFYKHVLAGIILGVIMEQVCNAFGILQVFNMIAFLCALAVLCWGVIYGLKHGGKDEDQKD